jgi:lipopolysaccharide export system protein LptA
MKRNSSENRLAQCLSVLAASVCYHKQGFALKMTSRLLSVQRALCLAGVFLAFSSGLVASSATTPSSTAAPRGATLPAGTGSMKITADQQSYDLENKRYDLSGHVHVLYKDMHISGSKAKVEMDAKGQPQLARFFNRPLFKRLQTKGQDTVVGDTILVYLTQDRYAAQGTVQSHVNTIAADPFYIRSDVQEFDNLHHVVAASGNVLVDYKDSKVSSNLANVRMTDAGKAERVIFSGGAHIQQPTTDVRGEKITIMVDSGNMLAESKVHTRVDLKNRAQPTDPPQVFLSSDYQQYDKASQTILASGNVKILYGTYYAVAPKATFKLKNNELDRMILTGRGTITEKDRVVTGNVITITTHPRNFDAQGDVKVNFKTNPAAGAPAATPPPVKGKTGAPLKNVPGKSNPAKPVDDPSDY